MKDPPADKRYKMLGFRVSLEEFERIKAFAKKLRETNRYLSEADVYRELISLVDTGLVTPEMRYRLAHPGAVDESEVEVTEVPDDGNGDIQKKKSG